MLKIAVFGFYSPDRQRAAASHYESHRSPVTTEDFMRVVWEMELPENRVGTVPLDGLGFVKLTTITKQPVYVQSLSDGMADSAGLLNCDGYIAIVDALKVLAPRTIQNALHRLAELHPTADLIIAAGRQNEPEALSSEELRAVLGLNPDLPVVPYVPSEPKTVHRLIRRMVRYIDNPDRVPPPIFAGGLPPIKAVPADSADADALVAAPAPTAPHIHGLDHVAIAVSDLGRALAFYQGVLGFRLLGQIDLDQDARGGTIAHLDTGRGLLALVAAAGEAGAPEITVPGLQSGVQHVALRVTHLDALFKPLQSAGVRVLSQPTNTAYGLRVAMVADPDGTLIELVEGQIVYTRR